MRAIRQGWIGCIAIALLAACGAPPGTPPAQATSAPSAESVSSPPAVALGSVTPATPETTGIPHRVRGWQFPPGLSIFGKAMIASGVVDTLRDTKSVTIFAPVDDAFMRLPEGAWQAILDDPVRLREVIEYHIVEGLWTTGALPQVSSLITLQGGLLTIHEGEGKRFTVNGAFILLPDFQLKRLVLHTIDTVLMPPP